MIDPLVTSGTIQAKVIRAEISGFETCPIVRSGTLHKYLKKTSPQTVELFIFIKQQLAEILKYLSHNLTVFVRKMFIRTL